MDEKEKQYRLKDKFYVEQVKQLYLRQPVGTISTIINSLLLVYIQRNLIPHSTLLIWFFSLFLVTLVRVIFYYKFRRTTITSENVCGWRNLFIIGIGLSGVLWGLAAVFLFPMDNVSHQIFTAFVLGGMVAGASSAFSALKNAFLAYSLPALLPIIIRFFSIPDETHFTMGLMTVLFAILVFLTAIRNYQNTQTSLMLRFENENLIQYLSQAKERTELANKELETEIQERKKAEEALRQHKEMLEILVKERTLELVRINEELKQEIIERKHAEKALKESEEKYRLLVENAKDGILIAQDGIVKYANPQTLKISGYTSEELAQIPFSKMIHPDDREIVIDRYTKRVKGEDVPSKYSFRIFSKDGRVLWLDLNAVLITWENKPATLNFLRDVTEQKRLEIQLQLAQKMESIGTLAGGIAHDFNNLLMGIQGNVSLMLLDQDPEHPDYEKLKYIENYVQSGAELTRQLLGFARGGKYEIKPTNLNEIVRRSSSMFGRTRKEIKIVAAIQNDLWTVEVDRNQIEQVLINLYINAWQAMPNGGDLHITTENVLLDDSFVKFHDLKQHKYVKISIRDTGMGIDEKIKQRIFDPFFTTKEMGRGTGLGLPSAYGIIKNHDGIIDFSSNVGIGSTFNVYLPASDKIVVVEKIVDEKLLEGKETVLLVDDEEIILDIGGKILHRMGFTVLTAKNGEEAVKVYREHVNEIDIVLLDIIMPGMDGAETFSELKVINPKVKVLLSSGYSINDQASELIKNGCRGFIQKPFGMKELSRKIRAILDEN